MMFFFFQAEDGIRDVAVTGVQTCALPICQGYIDIHLSLAGPAVAQQWLVYAVAGHFTKIESVARPGRVTAYRLPLWHYTTPLVAKRGREHEARRWVLLGTFLYEHGEPASGARS